MLLCTPVCLGLTCPLIPLATSSHQDPDALDYGTDLQGGLQLTASFPNAVVIMDTVQFIPVSQLEDTSQSNRLRPRSKYRGLRKRKPGGWRHLSPLLFSPLSHPTLSSLPSLLDTPHCRCDHHQPTVPPIPSIAIANSTAIFINRGGGSGDKGLAVRT